MNDRKTLSQFERALGELGVKVIHANSPQAKGRIERNFGTFQDRLVKEMRLKGIKTKDEANLFLKEYLPIYNNKFGVRAAKEAGLHMPVPDSLDLDGILCIKTRRTVRNDNTIAHDKKLHQLLDRTTAKRVMVEERTDGSMLVKHNGKSLRFKEIQSRPTKPKLAKPEMLKPRKQNIPPKSHPWRNFNYQKPDISICVKSGHF